MVAETTEDRGLAVLNGLHFDGGWGYVLWQVSDGWYFMVAETLGGDD